MKTKKKREPPEEGEKQNIVQRIPQKSACRVSSTIPPHTKLSGKTESRGDRLENGDKKTEDRRERDNYSI